MTAPRSAKPGPGGPATGSVSEPGSGAPRADRDPVLILGPKTAPAAKPEGAGQGERQEEAQGGGRAGNLPKAPPPPKPPAWATRPVRPANPRQTTAQPGAQVPATVPPAAMPAETRTPPAEPVNPAVPPPVAQSGLRRRHVAILLSFLLMVVAPVALSAWYLWTRAADQYASTVAFSVRAEESGSSIASVLGPLNLSGSATSDTDILYEFVQSQALVAAVDEKLDLAAIWSKPGPEADPVFSFHPPGTIEDLTDHWARMVKIFYDSGTGLMELRVLAFTPEDAQAIATEIYAESTRMINELSDQARADAIGYARAELDAALERLKQARAALTAFRNRTQIVDPTVDLQGQAGLLSTLNQQLAAAMIDADMLKQTTRPNDPRIAQAERRIDVIETRIAGEKRKLGIGENGTGTEAFATLVGEFERLSVDREFAETTYTAALASYDAARAEARRQSRYLATHVRPTLAQKSQYPERLTLLGLIGLFLFLTWTVLVLIAYSLRDRR